jgi:ABC-type uncharacterized transport system substrate-binding protein
MLKTFFISILFSTLLFSHPHTFIEVYPTIEVKDDKVHNLHFKWKLDDMSSSILVMEFDSNGDNEIDANENHYAYKNYFTLLESFGLFTEIKIKDRVQTLPKTTNFKTTIEDGRVCYSFDLKGSYNIKDLKIDFGDKDLFVAMIIKKEFLNIIGAKAKLSEVDLDFYFVHRLEFEKEK